MSVKMQISVAVKLTAERKKLSAGKRNREYKKRKEKKEEKKEALVLVLHGKPVKHTECITECSTEL